MSSEKMRHTALTSQENFVIWKKHCLPTLRTNETKLKIQLATISHTLGSYWLSEPLIYLKWQQDWQNHTPQSWPGSTLVQINEKKYKVWKPDALMKIFIWICPKQSGIHSCWNRFLCWYSAKKSPAAQNSIIHPSTRKWQQKAKTDYRIIADDITLCIMTYTWD
jgi:hypothetical protein